MQSENFPNAELFVSRSELESRDVANCLGVSLGISGTITQGLDAKLTASHESCKTTGGLTKGEHFLHLCTFCIFFIT